MSNIIVNNVKYRGYNFCQNISIVNPKKYKFFSLKDFEWFFVETQTDIKKYAFRHGAKVGATSNSQRNFKLTFTAFASDEEQRFELLRLISSIFNPPAIMSDSLGFYDLEFTTPDGTTRTTKAQTLKRPKISNYDNQNYVDVEVELVSGENSYIFSKKENNFTNYNTRMGKIIPNTMPSNSHYHKQAINYKGTSASPLNAKIKVLKTIQVPWMYIRSYIGEQLNTTMELGETDLQENDIIDINSFEETITLERNGQKTDFSLNLTINSEWLMISSPLEQHGSIAIVDCGIWDRVLEIEFNYFDIWD